MPCRIPLDYGQAYRPPERPQAKEIDMFAQVELLDRRPG